MTASLVRQIREVQDEVQKRREVYGNLVARGKMRQAEADYKIETMLAALGTLEWLHAKTDIIRRALAAPLPGERAP